MRKTGRYAVNALCSLWILAHLAILPVARAARALHNGWNWAYPLFVPSKEDWF